MSGPFTPRPSGTIPDWHRDPTLPYSKYELGDEVIDVKALVNDIVAVFGSLRQFDGYGAYEDHVGGIMDKLWPNWMAYFPALQLFEFSRVVRNAIREKLPGITFSP
jgi:hypothetical protein